jgi:hypothetical protein
MTFLRGCSPENAPPTAKLEISPLYGEVPLEVRMKVTVEDPDRIEDINRHRLSLGIENITIMTPIDITRTFQTPGNDLTKWEDWNFLEPQFDQTNLQPGQAYIPLNTTEVKIDFCYLNHSQSQGDYLDSLPILKFKIENGIPSLIWVNDGPNVEIITQRGK